MDRIRSVDEVREGSPDKPRKVNLFQSPRFFADVHVLRPGQSQAPHRHGGEDEQGEEPEQHPPPCRGRRRTHRRRPGGRVG